MHLCPTLATIIVALQNDNNSREVEEFFDEPQPSFVCRPRSLLATGTALPDRACCNGPGERSGAMEHAFLSDAHQPHPRGVAIQRESASGGRFGELSAVPVGLPVGGALRSGEWLRCGAMGSGSWHHYPILRFLGHVLQWHGGVAGREGLHQWRHPS